MTDEVQNEGVITEVASPETNQQEVVSEQKATDSRQDRNWREMRRQHDELLKKNQMQEELLQRLLQSQQAAPQQQVDESLNVADDDYIQGSQYKKLREKDKEDARKAAKEEVEALMAKREQMQFMDKLKRQFPDFEDYVNPETLSLLEETDPDLADTIAGLNDPYKIGLQSYKYIKATGLNAKVPASRRVKEVEKKIEENAKTVQTPQVFDKRPMAQAFKMSEADMKNLYNEMTHYASMSGGGY